VTTVVAALLGLLPLAFAGWLWRRTRTTTRLPWRRALLLAVLGGFSSAVALWVEAQALAFAELDASAPYGLELGLFSFSVLVAAPLEEALKVAVAWPFYLSRRLGTGRGAALHVAVIVAGYTFAECVLWPAFGHDSSWMGLVRLGLTLPAHFLLSGLWGYLLGLERRDRYFGAVWLVCAVLRGAYEHLISTGSAAYLAIALPVILLLVLATLLLLRVRDDPSRARSSVHSLLERASVASVRSALSRRGQPVMVHWILMGISITFGVTLVFLASAVYLGHAWGIDFALADEDGLEGLLPVLLLVAALLLAFPFSGYLIARASGVKSVLEPAWATGTTILVVLGVFSVTEPSAVVIALAIAPVGLTLACVGAWLGLDRAS
jgi:hypothetical protein